MRCRAIGQPSAEIGPGAAQRQRGNADRAAKIEREYLRSLIATKLERHEGQKHRLAGAGWTHNQGVTDVADMNGKPERGGAFGPAEEQWGRTEMVVPFRSRPHGWQGYHVGEIGCADRRLPGVCVDMTGPAAKSGGNSVQRPGHGRKN